MLAPDVTHSAWRPAFKAQYWGARKHRAGSPVGQPSALKP